MKSHTKNPLIAVLSFMLFTWSCTAPQNTLTILDKAIPAAYSDLQDTVNIAKMKWDEYFSDPNLRALIDTALRNNQELNIFLQNVEISMNEVKIRKGEYLPFLGLKGEAGLDKVGEFTRNGAVESQLHIKEETPFPEPLQDFSLGLASKWEMDIWNRLKNSKKAAFNEYLASVEGKSFLVTNLVAEVSNSYFELEALDNLLGIIQQNIEIQSNALKVVKQQKESAKVTQLAVNRFEAQLLNTRNLQYAIKQQIIETENHINFLTGKYPAPIVRSSDSFDKISVLDNQAGIPSQLLVNRPDIRQAELELTAARLDVKSARAAFYPSIGLHAGLGFQAFNPLFLFSPESMIYNLAGDLMAPIVNRNGIKAAFNTANAKQVQAAYEYEKTILGAYVDVLNQMSMIDNYANSYEIKSQEVEILKESVKIANSLFNSARADYGEVLLTQREALEAKMELIEIKLKQVSAKVNLYRALGGGW